MIYEGNLLTYGTIRSYDDTNTATNNSVFTDDLPLSIKGSAFIGGNAKIVGTIFGSNLQLSGGLGLTGDLDVRNVSASGNLTVSGDISFPGFTIDSSDVAVSKPVTVSNTLTVTSDLTANGDAKFAGNNLYFGKNGSSHYGSITANSEGMNAHIAGDLPIAVSQDSKSATLLDRDGNTSFPGKLTVGGDTMLSGKLTVSNETAINSSLTVGGDATVKDDYSLILSRTKTVDLVGGKPALIVGGAQSAAHTELGPNQIQAKANVGTTAGLEINPLGGDVNLSKAGGGTVRIKTNGGSDSTSSGALVVAGGVGIAENLNVGGNASVAGTASITGNTSISGVTSIANATDSTSDTTGALKVTGGVRVGKNLRVGGVTSITNTTDSDSTSTGALVVSGGVGITKKLRVGEGTTIGGATSITNTTDSDSASSGALVVAGGVGITKNLRVGTSGTVYITNTTDSSSTATGALQVSGGVGIAKNLNIGGSTQIGKLSENNDTATVITGSFIQGKKRVSGSDTNSDLTINDTAGNIILGKAGTDYNVQIKSTQESDTTTDGALVVDGGAKIANNLNVGGALNVSGGTTITGDGSFTGNLSADGGTLTLGKIVDGDGDKLTITTSSLQTEKSTSGTTSNPTFSIQAAGGAISMGKADSGNVTINSDDGSSTTATGALVVDGGVGIAENLNVGGNLSAEGGTLVLGKISGSPGNGDKLIVTPSYIQAYKEESGIQKHPDLLLQPDGGYVIIGSEFTGHGPGLLLSDSSVQAKNYDSESGHEYGVDLDLNRAGGDVYIGRTDTNNNLRLKLTNSGIQAYKYTKSGGVGTESVSDLSLNSAGGAISIGGDTSITSTTVASLDMGTVTAALKMSGGIYIDNYEEADFTRAQSEPYSLYKASGTIVTRGGIYAEKNLIVDSSVNAGVDGSGALVVSGGAQVGKDLRVAGDIFGSSFNATSSRKAKHDIEDFDISALDILNDVNVVNFKYNNDEKGYIRTGFIAEDTNELLATPEHNTMDIGSCIGVLIKAVQELSEENQKLREELRMPWWKRFFRRKDR